MATWRLTTAIEQRGILFLGALALLLLPQLAFAQSVTVTPITWNVVGLDSNDVNVGPNRFPVAARICNTGLVPLTNVSATFLWDSANPFIDLRSGSVGTPVPTPVSFGNLAVGACVDAYYEVEITRNALAYDTARRYHIAVTSTEGATGSTPTPREIYVERLISQARNSSNSLQIGATIPTLQTVGTGSSIALVQGETYFIRLNANTATAGYEQLETFVTFDNTVFQVLAVTTSYTADTSPIVPNPDDKLYGDGCGFENDPNSPNYRECLGDGKVGGTIVVTYQVRIVSLPGTNPFTLSAIVHDKSGSSYHYNSNSDSDSFQIAVIDPVSLTIDKNFNPDPTSATGVSALTFTITNPNAATVTGVNFTDTFPTQTDAMVAGPMVVDVTPGSTTNGCGTPTFSPVAGAGSIAFSNGTVGPNSTCTVKVNVYVPVAGTYTNTSSNLFIGSVDTGDSASDTLTVDNTPPPPPAVCGLALASWEFSTVPSPATTFPVTTSTVATAARSGDGVNATVFTGNPTNAWGSNGDITPGTTLVAANEEYFEFQLDTTGLQSVELTFQAARKSNPNSPRGIAVYWGTTSRTIDGVEGNGGAEPGTVLMSNATALPTGTTAWTSFGGGGALTFVPTTSPSYVRIYIFNSGNDNNGSDAAIDNVVFTGCAIPNPPTITKSFTPATVALNGTSSLSFTITNPNTFGGLTLNGVAFSDTFPAGVTVANPTNATTTGCGTPTFAPVVGAGSITFSGGTIAAAGTCTVTVSVTAATAGPKQNVSGFVTSTTSGTTNAGAAGIATASLTVVSPPSMNKVFSPSPILAGGISTLSFVISNPNTSDAVSGVAFTDTFPTLPVAPGAMVVAPVPNATTSGCGGAFTFAPLAGAGSIAFSGGTILGAGTCTVTVDVTAPTAGSYTNTSGAVSHIINAVTVNGNTASDTLQVNAPNPGLAFSKLISTSATGPWLNTVAVTPTTNVWYQFTVENTGDVDFTSVAITEDDPNLTIPGSCGFANPLPVADILDNDHIRTCVVGPIAAGASSFTNTASATGTYNPGSQTIGSNSDSATYQIVGLTFAKDAVQLYYTAAGQVINYNFTVTNTGSAVLAGPITVSDDKTSNESCPSLTTVGDLDNFLDPLESLVCTASYTILAGDTDPGDSVINTASATLGGFTTANGSDTVTLQNANFGHLPTTGPPVYASNLFNAGGARHLTGGTYLGVNVPTETDGTNGAFTTDTTNDDGVVWTPAKLWEQGNAPGDGGSIDATVVCPSAPCYLGAWIDWSGNGNYGDAGETISVTTWPVVNGLNTLAFNIPGVAGTLVNGSFYIRFRLYAADPGATLSPFGQATNSAGTTGTVGEVEDYYWTVTNGVVTPVTIAYFSARPQGYGTAIEWSTATESANVGFNLYVREGGKLVRLNDELIPSRTIDSLDRNDYSFYARREGTEFLIEEVSVLGETRRHGPFDVGEEYGGRADVDKIDWSAVRVDMQAATSLRTANAKGGAAPELTLGLKLNKTGIYRLTYESLRAAGVDLIGTPKTHLAITNQGQPVPVYVEANGNFGPGSYIEFQGQSVDTIYTDTNFYKLIVDQGVSVHMPVNNALPGVGLNAPLSYEETVLVENQRAYANYSPSDDAWYDTSMMAYTTPKSWSFPFEVSALADASAEGTMELVVWGLTDWPKEPDHHLVVSVNGTRVADERFDGLVVKALTISLPAGTLREGTNTLQLTLPGDNGTSYDVVNFDKFSVTYPRAFQARNGLLTFAADGKAFKVTNLPSSNVSVYRSDGSEKVRLRANVDSAPGNTFIATFAGSSKSATYFVSTSEWVLVPTMVPARPPADLDRRADYIVISHPSFLSGIQTLVQARQAQGLTVNVVDVSDLYARYTHGVFDPDAIRQYIGYAVRELDTRFVLLVGGDTYDYRNYLARNSISFIPSIYATTSDYAKFVPVDPKFADLDGDDTPDVAIGRFPVRTTAELDLIVKKTLAFESKTYRRTATFASDKFDGQESFKNINTALIAGLPPGWTTERIDLDNTTVALARTKLIAAMNRGTALVTFTGHSGPADWTFSGLFKVANAAALTNAGRPFVVAQWGCWNTYYVDPVNNYLVQAFLFSGDKGAAAVLGASTLTDSRSEKLLGVQLNPRMTTSGMPIGQALLDAKTELAKTHPELLDVLLGWTLMGDPAMVIEP